jgi:hypothetical protein
MTDFFDHTKKQLFWNAEAIFFIKSGFKCCPNVKMGSRMWKCENMEDLQMRHPGRATGRN